jgi:hypothetical protein
MEEMYGLPPDGFAGTRDAWEQLIHPDDRPVAERLLREALDSGSFESEWRDLSQWYGALARWQGLRV